MFGIDDFSVPIIDYSNFDFAQIGDVLIFGGSILLIGIATIFGVLCILWLCLAIFKVVFHDIPEKKASRKPIELSPVFDETPDISSAKANDDEIVAVIAAAIAMAESEHSGMKFRVVSFKRI